jgi:mitofilin
VPEPPKLGAETPASPIEGAPIGIPRAPPTPEAVGAVLPTPPPPPPASTTGPKVVAAPAPKPRRRGRFRRFLTTLFLLSSLGFAGGVYYSLISDNFHDFFTEYVPFGEDAVAYFEEREFRKRFPSRKLEDRHYPQVRGENKVQIGKNSGLTAQINDVSADTDRRHVSALEPSRPLQQPKEATPAERTAAVEKVVKKDGNKESKPQQLLPKDNVKSDRNPQTTAPKPSNAAPKVVAQAPTTAASQLDLLSMPNATEPVVQDVVKMLNNIITVVNADPSADKYASTMAAAKGQVEKIVADISTLKAQAQKQTEEEISNAHTLFDTAAKELVGRLQSEMQDQEAKWREEYESEREKLSQSYQTKLKTELDVARKVAEQRTRNSLIEQEIELQRRFAKSVRDRIEEERNGRLARLDELSDSVSDLEKLTGQWNKVIDSNLATQHLHVALESVRHAISKHDHPTPFVNELAALKEISNNNELVSAAVASIPPTAYQRGVPSSAHLIDRFRRVASEVRKAALLPEDAGIASHAASAVLSRFMFNKQGAGMPEGDDVEAVLSRTQVFLEEGDVDGAAREMNSLGGWAGVLSKDWVAECRRVLETKQAIDVSFHTLLPSLPSHTNPSSRSSLPKPDSRVFWSIRLSQKLLGKFVHFSRLVLLFFAAKPKLYDIQHYYFLCSCFIVCVSCCIYAAVLVRREMRLSNGVCSDRGVSQARELAAPSSSY